MRLRKALPSFALVSSLLVGGMALPQRADADVNLSISLGDDRFDQFRGGLRSYFGVPEDQILLMDRRGLSGYEAPVALYISKYAGVSPVQILDLRQRGMRWNDVVSHYGLSPEIFYVPVNDYEGPYADMYSHPRSQWDQMYLSDEDYINMANLKFMTDHYGYEPDRVVRLRSEGRDFLSIASLIAGLAGAGTHSSYGSSDTSLAGDLLGSFLYAATSHFNRPEREIYLLRDRGLRETEIPVALYLASRAGIDPISIVDLRRRGMSWYDITRRYGLSPEIYYVPVDYDDYYGDPMYGSAYDMFQRYPRSQWDRVRLSDEQIMNLANLRFLSERYQTPPGQVIRLRRQGNDFPHITRQFQQERGEQIGVNANPGQRQQRVDRRQQRLEQEKLEQQRQQRAEGQRAQRQQQRIEQERIEQRRQQRQDANRETNRQDRLEQERQGQIREQRRQERQEAAREQQRAEQGNQQQAREERRQERQEGRADERPRKKGDQGKKKGRRNKKDDDVRVGTP